MAQSNPKTFSPKFLTNHFIPKIEGLFIWALFTGLPGFYPRKNNLKIYTTKNICTVNISDLIQAKTRKRIKNKI